MRLISVILRKYRLHKECKIEFDSSRTLIGGQNETGKSTIVEAIHRVLFTKAKGGSKTLDKMKSSIFLGDPEVELEFEVNGKKYVLAKRFGRNGTTKLSIDGRGTIHANEAEEELINILGEQAFMNQWAHLWVWQGKAGENPSEFATEQRHELLQQLQKLGAAAIFQSDLDNQLAKRFANSVDEIFTQAKKPKKGSDLERAESEYKVAQEIYIRATDRLEKLETDANNLDAAEKELPEIEDALQELEIKRNELLIIEKKYNVIKQQEKEQSLAAKNALEKYNSIESANNSIKNFVKEMQEIELLMMPQNGELSQLENAKNKCKQDAEKTEREYRQSIDIHQNSRNNYDLALAFKQQFDCIEELERIEEKQKIILGLQKELDDFNQQYSKYPDVDKIKIRALHRLENTLSEAVAILQAMAAGLEVVSSEKKVVAGGKPVETGQKVILTEDTELLIGKDVHLLITPGGGTSLLEARMAETEAKKALYKALNVIGVKNVSEASIGFNARDELRIKMNTIESKLVGMGADTLSDELTRSQNDLTSVQSRVESIVSRILSPIPNLNKDTIDAYETKTEIESRAAENKVTTSRTLWDKKVEELESATQNYTSKQREIQEEKKKLDDLKAQHNLMIKTHGDDHTRAKIIAEYEAERNQTNIILQTTLAEIAELQPELLEMDIERNDRAIKVYSDKRNDLQREIAIARAKLHSDGQFDPREDVINAEFRVRNCDERKKGYYLKAEAIGLLDKLFQEAQKSLSDQFTQPLVDKISGYLQCIYGAGTSAHMSLEEGEFIGLSLSRAGFKGETFNFDTLSGGTKEQVAAAVRLAMAEVLATDFGGCLPLVFDDAFTNADPSRVGLLQRMLDLAASRGLQIIVLTCNPADYVSLGAKEIIIRPPSILANNRSMNDNFESGDNNAESYLSENLEKTSIQFIHSTNIIELQDKLITKIKELGGKSGNQTLRNELGWEEDAYNAIKDRLVETGILVSGKGRGGSIALNE
jgi:DNA repair exonuclease SbcCD ATPase subunit